MISSNFTQRSWQGFLALCLCLFTLQAFAATEAAVVLFSHGVVTKVNGSERLPLAKGDQLAAGDTVNTGEDGRVQMRFTDGGLVSLMPSSSFAIDRYNQPDTQDGGSLSFRLMKGGLRTITGSIGQKNHDNYELKTDVATLGIRGTEFVVVIDGDAMRVQVNEGLISLQNQLGDLMVPAGQNAVVFPQQAPTLSDTAPLFISSTATNGGGSTTQTTAASSPTDSSPIASNSQTNDSLAQSLPAQTMLSPAERTSLVAHVGGTTNTAPPVGVSAGFAYAQLLGGYHSSLEFSPQNLVSAGITTFSAAVNTHINPVFYDNVTRIENAEGTLFWGKYTEPSRPNMYNASIWGTPATNMPTTGTLSYSLTNVALAQNLSTDSSLNPGQLRSFDLSIHLGANTTFDVRMGFDDTMMDFDKSGLSGNMSGPASFVINQFKTDISSPCSNGCDVNVSGFLTGSGGSRAATVYSIQGTDGFVDGSAILDKQ